MAQKLVQMATSLNKYSFRSIHMLTPFCTKTNLRENRFFLRPSERLVGKKALIMLNLLLKTRQCKHAADTREWSTTQKSCRLATARTSGCRACCSQTTASTSWKRRSNRPSTSSFLLVKAALNNFRPYSF